VSTSMISNECMICHMKVHIVSYNLDQNFFSKSKIHILPNYEQTNLKTAIVYYLVKHFRISRSGSTENEKLCIKGSNSVLPEREIWEMFN
jgi:hypothetical protein